MQKQYVKESVEQYYKLIIFSSITFFLVVPCVIRVGFQLTFFIIHDQIWLTGNKDKHKTFDLVTGLLFNYSTQVAVVLLVTFHSTQIEFC
jgi:hypothetical protein